MSTLPTVYTRPLSEDYPTDGTKLREFVDRFVKTVQGRDFVKQEWQLELFDRVLERYPANHPDPDKAGHLRYRQVVISFGRQNGKSVIAALLGLYGLTKHVKGPSVIGLASNADQANIIYDYVKETIDGAPALRERFKTTSTRGIKRLGRVGSYKIKPAKADALQGFPTSMCLFDEVHICDPDMWQAMVKGTTSFDDGIVIGLTTAGNDDSILLKSLYELGRKAAAGDPDLERFGFFCWEAPEGSAVDDPNAIKAANPSVAAGLIPVSRIQDQVRTEPPHMARRFTLNQFVTGSSPWLDVSQWLSLGSGGLPEGTRPVLTVERTPGRAHASITATAKVDGRFYTELVADYGDDQTDPTDEFLLEECMKLNRHNPVVFAMDKYPLGDLAKMLESRGVPVRVITSLTDICKASEFAYRQVSTGKLTHTHDERLTAQIPRAVVKQLTDERYRIVRTKVPADMVLGMAIGLYVAETYQEIGIQLF